MTYKSFEVRDPIYGFIPFDDWEKTIIDSPPFQRLRRIQQLALTSFLYPSATHTRFEHSLGVMHMATMMFDAIVNNQNNLKLLNKYLGYQEPGLKKARQLVRLSALLHDIGHGPFSHALESVLPQNNKTGKKFKHEEYSCSIIRNELKETIENHITNSANYEIKADDIAGLIEGNSKIVKNKLFWRVLISSQLDADRGDYLLRDSHHMGVKYGVYDYARLLNTLAIGIDPETNNDLVLGIKEGGWHVAESVILARYQMTTQVYYHKTRRIYDYHLKEAIKYLYKNEVFPSPEELQKYLALDEYSIWEMLKKNLDNIHCKALVERKHFRSIYKTMENADNSGGEIIDNIEATFKKNGIEYFIDRLKGSWYKIGHKEIESPEIMIISDENDYIKPLSEYSHLIKNLDETNQSRVYIDLDKKIKAEELINEYK